MQQYDHENLIVRAEDPGEQGLLVEVTPERAGWDTIHFQARRLESGSSWSFATGENELALVVLGGRLAVDTNRGRWTGIGRRENVFAGLPYALYLSAATQLTVTAETGCEFAAAWVSTVGGTPTASGAGLAGEPYPPRLVTPAEIGIEIRGGDNATRQINSILPPGFPCARLVVVEVYTPGGNWSSYPPHKHDIHKTGPGGTILEADLDEIYYYKIDRPEGYAVQRVYSDRESPLRQAGLGVDALLMPGNNDVVLIPEGYHPVASPPGYTTYYLNVLAGSAQSLAASDDPNFAWVKGSYKTRDPRVPVYAVKEPL